MIHNYVYIKKTIKNTVTTKIQINHEYLMCKHVKKV